jgi:hypothetical protein
MEVYMPSVIPIAPMPFPCMPWYFALISPEAMPIKIQMDWVIPVFPLPTRIAFRTMAVIDTEMMHCSNKVPAEIEDRCQIAAVVSTFLEQKAAHNRRLQQVGGTNGTEGEVDEKIEKKLFDEAVMTAGDRQLRATTCKRIIIDFNLDMAQPTNSFVYIKASDPIGLGDVMMAASPVGMLFSKIQFLRDLFNMFSVGPFLYFYTFTITGLPKIKFLGNARTPFISAMAQYEFSFDIFDQRLQMKAKLMLSEGCLGIDICGCTGIKVAGFGQPSVGIQGQYDQIVDTMKDYFLEYNPPFSRNNIGPAAGFDIDVSSNGANKLLFFGNFDFTALLFGQSYSWLGSYRGMVEMDFLKGLFMFDLPTDMGGYQARTTFKLAIRGSFFLDMQYHIYVNLASAIGGRLPGKTKEIIEMMGIDWGSGLGLQVGTEAFKFSATIGKVTLKMSIGGRRLNSLRGRSLNTGAPADQEHKIQRVLRIGGLFAEQVADLMDIDPCIQPIVIEKIPYFRSAAMDPEFWPAYHRALEHKMLSDKIVLYRTRACTGHYDASEEIPETEAKANATAARRSHSKWWMRLGARLRVNDTLSMPTQDGQVIGFDDLGVITSLHGEHVEVHFPLRGVSMNVSKDDIETKTEKDKDFGELWKVELASVFQRYAPNITEVTGNIYMEFQIVDPQAESRRLGDKCWLKNAFDDLQRYVTNFGIVFGEFARRLADDIVGELGELARRAIKAIAEIAARIARMIASWFSSPFR